MSKFEEKKDFTPLVNMIMKAVALAMGVGVAALSILNQLDVSSGFFNFRVKMTMENIRNCKQEGMKTVKGYSLKRAAADGKVGSDSGNI